MFSIQVLCFLREKTTNMATINSVSGIANQREEGVKSKGNRRIKVLLIISPLALAINKERPGLIMD